MQDGEIQGSGFLGNRGAKSCAAAGQAYLPFRFHRIPDPFHFVAVDACFFRIALEQRTDGVVATDTFDVDDRGLHPLFIDLRPISIFGKIAFCHCEMLQEFRLETFFRAFLGELQGACRVMDDLDGFDARQFVEEPSATGVHEQSMTLHLEKFEGSDLLVGLERPDRVINEECFPGLLGAIKNYADVVVASGPWVADIVLQTRLEDGSQFVAQPVERRPQRSAPLLVPRMSAGVASTIAAPAFDAVDATPRTVVDDLHEMFGGMFFQKFAVVGELGDVPSLDFVQCIGERHFAMVVMMAVAFSVGGDVNQLRSLAGVGEAAHQPFCKSFAVVQQSLEGNALRDGPIVEEQIDPLFRWQFRKISSSRVNAGSAYVFELGAVFWPYALGLPWRKNRELNSILGQDLESFGIHGGFRQPHSFGAPSEPAFKIPHSPLDLSHFVPAIGERKDHVVVTLRQSGSMTGKPFRTPLVGLKNRLANLGSLVFHPGQKSGSEVETHLGVVVEQFDDAILGVNNSRSRVRSVALGRNALIPVVIRIGGVLQLNRLKVRVFARGLIEMPMDANVFHAVSVFGWIRSMTRNECGDSRNSSAVNSVISGARFGSGPFHEASAERITVVHSPAKSGTRKMRGTPAKLHTIASCRRPLSYIIKSAQPPSSRTVREAGVPNCCSSRMRM